MVRSFDRRLESLFLILDKTLRKEAMNILQYNLKDNVNSYLLKEEGTYERVQPAEGEAPFNIHHEFYRVRMGDVVDIKLVEEEVPQSSGS